MDPWNVCMYVCICMYMGYLQGMDKMMETVVKGTHFIVNMDLGSHCLLYSFFASWNRLM